MLLKELQGSEEFIVFRMMKSQEHISRTSQEKGWLTEDVDECFKLGSEGCVLIQPGTGCHDLLILRRVARKFRSGLGDCSIYLNHFDLLSIDHELSDNPNTSNFCRFPG
jgi:hypothetical protein